MKKIALKINVYTYRGTREGVPRLVKALKKYDAQATFFFSLGPDHTGRAIKRVFRPGFMGMGARSSVLEHYGLKTLLYGTLLPGPDIGRHCAHILRSVQDAGFETGIHCYDHVHWQHHVANESAEWTRREMQRAVDRYTEIFGVPPKAHAAAGWQMNRHALRLTQGLGFTYSSDTRGIHPFTPMWNAEIVACPQLPTTLPTLDEIISCNDITPDNAALCLLKMIASSSDADHVFTLHAEMEGGKWLPIFEQLLSCWKEQGYLLVSLRQYLDNLNGSLPRHEITTGTVAGRSGTLAVQGLSTRLS